MENNPAQVNCSYSVRYNCNRIVLDIPKKRTLKINYLVKSIKTKLRNEIVFMNDTENNIIQSDNKCIVTT